MKKQKTTPIDYKFEFIDTGKKRVHGEKIYHLFINGKTDSTEYNKYKKEWYGEGHKREFAKMMHAIPGKYFPDKLFTSVEYKLPVIRKDWDHMNYVIVETKDNKFTVGIYLSTPDNEFGSHAYIHSSTYAECLKNEIRKNKKSRAEVEEEVDYDLCVRITGKPKETINDLVKLLLPAIELAFEKAKNNLLLEIKKMENKIKSGAVKWL